MHETTTTPLQYLSFSLGGLEYGIDVATVQELRVLKALERVASQGEIIGGVAVSRGVIMPLVDLRVACGTGAKAPDPMTDVIIVRLSGNATGRIVGLVVDGVTGVMTLEPAQVMPVPGLDEREAGYLIGLAQLGSRKLILIDIGRLMSVRGQGTRSTVDAGAAGSRQVA